MINQYNDVCFQVANSNTPDATRWV